jgi:cobalamin synthase
VETWEQWVAGALALVVVFFFFPGVRDRVKNSPKGSTQDWMGALIPIAMVVGFVVLMVVLI